MIWKRQSYWEFSRKILLIMRKRNPSLTTSCPALTWYGHCFPLHSQHTFFLILCDVLASLCWFSFSHTPPCFYRRALTLSFVPGLPRSLMAGSFSLFRALVKNISPESPSDTYLSPVSQTCSLVTVHSTALLVSFITWLSLERKWQEGRHRGCLFIAACPAPE